MARRRRPSKSSVHQSVRRDLPGIASRQLIRLPLLFSPARSGQELRVLEDRRVTHLDTFRPARTARRWTAPVVVAPAKKALRRAPLLSGLRFKAPKQVLICVRRGIRKEVLHAKKVAGRRGLKKPRRSAFSGVSC